MRPGTNPAIVGLPNGSYEVAFQANTSDLWTVGSDNHDSWGLGMMAGTSPAITLLGGGNNYEVAFQANTSDVWTVGADNHGNWGPPHGSGHQPDHHALYITAGPAAITAGGRAPRSSPRHRRRRAGSVRRQP